MTDHELLARYAADGSHDSFAELACRHTDMVYATCMRILNDKDAAEDATQATFVVLMKKAGRISDRTVVSGWLFQTARNSALLVRKKSIRRAKHEREAAAMRAKKQEWSGEPPWEEVRPHVDDALAALPSKYRDVIVLRYLQGMSEAETAQVLGCKEGAVAMRLSRGLQKLRARLRRKGVIVTGAVLAMFLGTKAAQAAPADLVASISAGGMAATGAIPGIAEGVVNMMMWAKIKTAATILVAASAVGAVGIVGAGVVRPESPVEEAQPEQENAQDTASIVEEPPSDANAPATRDALPEDDADWPWGEQVDGLQSRIVLERRRLKQGEPIVAEVQIQSVSYSQVAYDPRPVEWDARPGTSVFRIIGPDRVQWSSRSGGSRFQVIGPDGSEAPGIGRFTQSELETKDYLYPTLGTDASVAITKRKLHTLSYMGAPGRYQLMWMGSRPLPDVSGEVVLSGDVRLVSPIKPPDPAVVALPPSATVEIEVLPAPGGGPDGDFVGRLLGVMPPGWKINGATTLGDVRPDGRQRGRGSAALLIHFPMGNTRPWMRVSVTTEPCEPDPKATGPLAEYLGKGKLGNVYLSRQGKPGARWTHAAHDIAVALEVQDPPPKPAGPDWGRMVSTMLAECFERSREVEGLGLLGTGTRLAPYEGELARIDYESNLIPPWKSRRAAAKNPERSYYKVLLSVLPAGLIGHLDMTVADRSIAWDGKESVRGYVVRRLGLDIVIEVTTNDKPFREALNAIFDREISRVLAETAGE